MSDAPQYEAHHRPHTPSMAERLMEFDLPAEVHRLHAETTWSTGQNARTLIKYDDFRVVLTALQAKVRIPEHKAEGRISVRLDFFAALFFCFAFAAALFGFALVLIAAFFFAGFAFFAPAAPFFFVPTFAPFFAAAAGFSFSSFGALAGGTGVLTTGGGVAIGF